MVVRQYQEELKYLEKMGENQWKIKIGFQPNMKVVLSFLQNTETQDKYFKILP